MTLPLLLVRHVSSSLQLSGKSVLPVFEFFSGLDAQMWLLWHRITLAFSYSAVVPEIHDFTHFRLCMLDLCVLGFTC